MNMFKRHEHQWIEVSRRFNAPEQEIRKATCSEGTLLRVLYGFTVVELKCTCGDVGHRTVVGRID